MGYLVWKPKDEIGSYYEWSPFEPYLRCYTTDFQSWTTDRKVFVSATCQGEQACHQKAHMSVKCKSLPLRRHPYFGVPRRDGFLLCAATFRAMSPVFYDRFSKLNGRSKGLCVSYMPLLVRMPSNSACVRQMQNIASVTSYILGDLAWSRADRILIWIYLRLIL